MITTEPWRVVVVDVPPALAASWSPALRAAGLHPRRPNSTPGPGNRARVVAVVTADSRAGGVDHLVHAGLPRVALVAADTPLAYLRALRAGATGVLTPGAVPSLVVTVVKGASEGRTILPVPVAQALAESMQSPPRAVKVFACGDVVTGCLHVFRAGTEDEILAAVAAHARAAHAIAAVPPELVAEVRRRIQTRVA